MVHIPSYRIVNIYIYISWLNHSMFPLFMALLIPVFFFENEVRILAKRMEEIADKFLLILDEAEGWNDGPLVRKHDGTIQHCLSMGKSTIMSG